MKPKNVDVTAVNNGGGPLMLPLDLIDEDPQQPRAAYNPGFSEESITELAASIELRGVKTPISVRENPAAPGRYLINHGARRLRAAKQAGKKVIPGFVDNDHQEADQIIENLQRNELTARELADYIGRELAKGVKKGEIAKSISKSPAFVTQHITLLDLPDPIAEAFNSERARDVTVINELVTLYKTKPGDVAAWLGFEDQEITRGSVKLLRDFLDDKGNQEQQQGAGSGKDGENGKTARKKAGRQEKSNDSTRFNKAVVRVRHKERPARLILDRRPLFEGSAWLRYDDDGQEAETNLIDVMLVALVEG
jgi:ParB family transcriptional regulator, chromosome partitioning protein